MSDGFWTMVGVVAPVFIVQICALITAYLTNKKATASREEIKGSLAEVKDHINTVKMEAVRSKTEVETAHKAGLRDGYVGGIEEGKRQATGPMPLGK